MEETAAAEAATDAPADPATPHGAAEAEAAQPEAEALAGFEAAAMEAAAIEAFAKVEDPAAPPATEQEPVFTLQGLYTALRSLTQSHEASLGQLDQMRRTQHELLNEVRAATAGVAELREEQRALAEQLEQRGAVRSSSPPGHLRDEMHMLLGLKLDKTSGEEKLYALEAAREAVDARLAATEASLEQLLKETRGRRRTVDAQLHDLHESLGAVANASAIANTARGFGMSVGAVPGMAGSRAGGGGGGSPQATARGGGGGGGGGVRSGRPASAGSPRFGSGMMSGAHHHPALGAPEDEEDGRGAAGLGVVGSLRLQERPPAGRGAAAAAAAKATEAGGPAMASAEEPEPEPEPEPEGAALGGGRTAGVATTSGSISRGRPSSREGPAVHRPPPQRPQSARVGGRHGVRPSSAGSPPGANVAAAARMGGGGGGGRDGRDAAPPMTTINVRRRPRPATLHGRPARDCWAPTPPSNGALYRKAFRSSSVSPPHASRPHLLYSGLRGRNEPPPQGRVRLGLGLGCRPSLRPRPHPRPASTSAFTSAFSSASAAASACGRRCPTSSSTPKA